MLSDFRWLHGRILGHGRASILSDCAFALAVRTCASANSTSGTRVLTGGAEKSIRMLHQTLMLAGEGMLIEYDGTLAGSLVQLARSSVDSGDAEVETVFFTRLAGSTNSGVRGSWIKPMYGCSRSRGGEGGQHL